MTDKILTPAQAAERLQVSIFSIQEWLRQGKLKGFKAGRLWRIREADLDDFVKRGGGDRSMIEVVVVEAGEGYTERREVFKAELAGSEQDMVKQAMALVAARGYRVLPAEMGGCCEYVAVSGGPDYIAVSVQE